ncbi:phosphodiester glycosidase family protein [Sedimentitalea sp. JM2-8]|uniref:Phosphodiester glycosidase family protein n=1 Tax=Sedimentitalea xiamensis TaxID=3050037 RepID=A0ABT7FGZ7_9RHOB|nr:phosphodiester glycosidase family protein [Sedimentitalea xiamensis]MDK3074223.1 phosphodiester glycosidase family protein [Sedimentitalea xiamensis]
MIRAPLTLILAALALPALAQDCRDLTYEGNPYTLCEVDTAQADLRLFLADDTGTPFGQFSAVDRALAEQGKTLGFAMNAGMYHSDRSPVGYYVENGIEIMGVVPGAGPGNFGLVPNGVFCIREDRADVIETTAFLSRGTDCSYATQSGPMLVIDGALHPRFLVDSTSRYVRNGVGTTADGSRAFFVMSSSRVTFHEFGRLFRDALDLPNALYFDGNVSRLHAPQIGRSDAGFAMGPIVGTVVDLGASTHPSN